MALQWRKGVIFGSCSRPHHWMPIINVCFFFRSGEITGWVLIVWFAGKEVSRV